MEKNQAATQTAVMRDGLSPMVFAWKIFFPRIKSERPHWRLWAEHFITHFKPFQEADAIISHLSPSRKKMKTSYP